MNLQHLRYAVEVQRTGSISQAAENLYMGQPNLSKAIKELERECGVTIFQRTTKGVLPTQKGELFLSYARSILGQMDEIAELCSDTEPSSQSFGVSVPRASYIAAAFVRFVGSFALEERMAINFPQTSSPQTIRGVLEGEFRMGIIRYHQRHEPFFLNYIAEKGLEHRLIWAFDEVALMGADHPLAGEERIDSRRLTDSVEIVHGDLSVPYLPDTELRRQQTPEAGRRIYVYERGSQFDLLTHLNGSFMWVSPVPEELLERHRLVQRPGADGDRRYKDVLIHREGYRLSELDQLFLDEVGQVLEELQN